ncbi:MAG: hypothetical protein NVV59_10395 [Chitinophagaceae bacterium]|nr:hypothetical protein [Chitinophagaceae bacterium]
MKQILLALCAFFVFTACNNEKKQNGFGGNMFGDPNNQNNNANNNNPNNNKNRGGNNGRWSKELKDYVTNACLQEVGQVPQAREKCDCWVGKVEAKFPTITNTSQIDESIANQLAMECMQNFGGNTGGFGDEGFHGFDDGGYDDGGYNDGGYNGEDGGYDRDGLGYNKGGNTNRGGTWPAAQRQQWMMGCTTTAQQQMGLTQQQANSYCDCMTRKVEAKYNFTDATKLTVQDFSTPEWVNARMECQMNLGY